nr:PREDICTED: venom protease-like [Bemisia tabaci]
MKTSVWLVTVGLCVKLVISAKVRDEEDIETSIEPETVNKLTSLPGSENCGLSGAKTGRIVGGEPAKLGAWPWVAAVGIPVGKEKSVFFCGASLISDKYAVTAAHCFTEFRSSSGQGLKDGGRSQEYKMIPGMILRVGDLNLDDTVEDGAKPETITIEKVVSHPLFITKRSYGETKGYDIALLKLQKPVTFSDLVRPICLPHKDIFYTNKDFEGYQPFVAGWGLTNEEKKGGKKSDQLLQIQLPLLGSNDCVDLLKRAAKTEMHEDSICAMAEGKDACQGDSGGPLALPIDDRYYLYGIVSYGPGCARKDAPGYYNKVHTHLKWIASLID